MAKSARKVVNGAATGGGTVRAEYIPSHGAGRLMAPWKPGQSGNPTGVVDFNAIAEARMICARATPEAARKQVELLSSDDPRVAFMATEAILNRGGVKPAEAGAGGRIDLTALSGDELKSLAVLLKKALGIE